jgi:hypothetical protein
MSQYINLHCALAHRRLVLLAVGIFTAALVSACGGVGSSNQGPQLPGRPATVVGGDEPSAVCITGDCTPRPACTPDDDGYIPGPNG